MPLVRAIGVTRGFLDRGSKIIDRNVPMGRIRAMLALVVFPVLLAGAAMIPQSWGPLDLLNGISIAGHSPAFCVRATADAAFRCKANVAMAFVFIVTFVSVIGVALKYELPLGRLDRLKRFRRQYLDTYLRPILSDLRRRYGRNIRLNVMIVRRSRMWPFTQVFSFEYQCGFDAPYNHHDRGIRLTTSQGVAGEALRRQKPVARFVSRNGAPGVTWGLSKKQQAMTRHVRWILSVPMFLDQPDDSMERPRVRGVINVDATDDATARSLHTSQNIETLSRSLLYLGRIASHLW